MTTPTTTQQDDQDVHKGAVEGDKASDKQPGNAHGSGLDKNGLPVDKKAICEDAIGANVDKSQG